jgi:hypothetical protein
MTFGFQQIEFIACRNTSRKSSSRSHAFFRAQVADGTHDLLDQLEVGDLVGFPAFGLARFGELGDDERIGASLCDTGDWRFAQGAVQVSPNLFGHKRSEGMQQAQGDVKHARQRLDSLRESLVLHLLFGNFHVPVRKVRPDEIVDLLTSLPVLEVLELPLHVADEFADEPRSMNQQGCDRFTN